MGTKGERDRKSKTGRHVDAPVARSPFPHFAMLIFAVGPGNGDFNYDTHIDGRKLAWRVSVIRLPANRRGYWRARVRSRWVQAIGSGIQGAAFAARLHRDRGRWQRFVGSTHDRLAVRRSESVATRFQAPRNLQLAFEARDRSNEAARTAWRIDAGACSRRDRRAVSRGGDLKHALGSAATSGEELLRHCDSHDREAVSSHFRVPRLRPSP